MSSAEISIVAAEDFEPGLNASSHNEGTNRQVVEVADDLQLVSDLKDTWLPWTLLADKWLEKYRVQAGKLGLRPSLSS